MAEDTVNTEIKKENNGSKSWLIVLFIICELIAVYFCVTDIVTTALTQIEDRKTAAVGAAVMSFTENLDMQAGADDGKDEYNEWLAEEEEKNRWKGPYLSKSAGVVYGPSGKETYYNLNMSKIVNIMHSLGFEGEYWVRDDGCKMFGDYIMVAANYNIRPRGTLVETSLGTGIVCDTGGFAKRNPYQLDLAVTW